MDDPAAGTQAATGTSSPLSMLVLTPGQHEQIVTHLRAALPNEGVALLAGPGTGPDGVVRPTRFFPGTNALQSPVRYRMDWDELVAAIREIDRDDLHLVVIAHSHTRGPARPSATDLAEAWYPDTLMVIVSFAVEPPDLRAWALDGEEGAWRPREVPVVHEDGGAGSAGIAAYGHVRE